MAGGTNNIKRPGYPDAAQPGGKNGGEWMPPQMITGGPYGPGPGGVPPQWTQPGQPQWGQPGQQQPTPDQMEEWKACLRGCQK